MITEKEITTPWAAEAAARGLMGVAETGHWRASDMPSARDMWQVTVQIPYASLRPDRGEYYVGETIDLATQMFRELLLLRFDSFLKAAARHDA